MGTIFKYNNQFIQCQNLQKKLRKMKINEQDIEIIKDNIPSENLEKEFVDFTKQIKTEEDTDNRWHYFIFQNSKGYYLWGINKPDISYYKNFGFEISDYKLIDECIGGMPNEYYKWNPETKTGRKDIN